ncbi:MAG: 16S rRNA (cytidine(1402)-2'-O)-methyltransferase, partial [Spirochaetes bacterium]|nr:16S rRNA (cytidine(1402)-2'-O)-methyltransferase [Spirochaetota bacterium]
MNKGTLYIIGTPIGNLSDITIRAIETLKENTDYVFCEDTRISKRLLSHYNISVPLQSLHAHSPGAKVDYAISLLNDGKSIAYMTDSGTPGLSDPGSSLVKSARMNGIKIEPIPGPSALTSLLSVSGFQSKNIIFAGFLSKKEGKQKKELAGLKEYNGIIVIFESPYRIKKLLTSIHEIFPGCELVIGREITKFHEEFIAGTTEEIYNNIDRVKEK